MKKHLIKFIASAEIDYRTSTYCKIDSEEWSENFVENINKKLTKERGETTCKECIDAYEKETRELEIQENFLQKDVAEKLIKGLGPATKDNQYLIKADEKGIWWIEHKEGREPLIQWLTGKSDN